MTEFAKVGSEQICLLVLGTILMLVVPLVVAILWTKRKKERLTTVLAGAATFLLFALILEKPIQNVLIFPTQMGLAEHAASRFINERPVLWAFLVSLFPGVFEETGRLVAFKTVLKNRKNRETSISHGLGHGGFEVMLILGLTYATYISYAVMINTGTFGTVVDQVMAQSPEQAEQVYALAGQIAAFSFGDLAVAVVERIFAVLNHTGASILVFYACREKKKFWLYPLAIVLHTALDGVAAFNMAKIITLSTGELEVFVAVLGSLTFGGAYFLLYKKDSKEKEIIAKNKISQKDGDRNG